jgi:hypothetical protein
VIRRGNNRCYLQTLQGSRGVTRPRNSLTGTVQVDRRSNTGQSRPNFVSQQRRERRYPARRWPMRSGVVRAYLHVWACDQLRIPRFRPLTA